MASPEMAYTKLTCVHYGRGDLLGKALAHASLLPVLLLCGQAAKVYTRREVHEGFVLVGLLLSEAAARGLKHLLRSPRPPASCALLGVCDAHGMPSSHTTMMFSYLMLTSAIAVGLAARQRPAARAWAALELGGVGMATALVAASRVYLGYHSPAQVAAGAALGCALGGAWFLAMRSAGAAGLFAGLAGWAPAARLLLAKDTWGCPEPLLVEQGAAYSGGGGARGRPGKRE
ncbi:MAG: hypothetical protein J3K34DRAFT_107063 [Monoraphidium minutum]|nr:MAG: hypothetical protein J3K34DRAFT_107063 [Monoraphidium minutum]